MSHNVDYLKLQVFCNLFKLKIKRTSAVITKSANSKLVINQNTEKIISKINNSGHLY